MDSPFMRNMAGLLASRGLQVVRFEFPYMRRRRATGGKRPPDGRKVLLATWREVLGALGGGAQVVMAGKSMGGRMASLLADEVGARGLVCLGYPFHPSGRPDQLRVEHLQEVKTPMLIVQGERDALGNAGEVPGYGLDPAIEIEWLPDGDHSFLPRHRSGHTATGNMERAADRIAAFVAGLG